MTIFTHISSKYQTHAFLQTSKAKPVIVIVFWVRSDVLVDVITNDVTKVDVSVSN
jgi:hypothetical protein